SQAEFQALAFRTVLGLEQLRVFDIDSLAVEKVRRNLEPLGMHGHIAESVDEAIDGTDGGTNCIADQSHLSLLTADQVRPGTPLNAIGGDCPGKTELDPQILEDARVVVEFEPQTRIEGEIQQMPRGFPVTELWEVLEGSAPGRVSAHEVTVFDS